MDFLYDYGLYLAQTLTLVIGIIVVLMVFASLFMKDKKVGKEKLHVKNLNDKLQKLQNRLNQAVLNKADLKIAEKKLKHQQKEQAKTKDRHRVFVLEFDGDIKASAVETLRNEITALLTMVTPKDEVVIKLESPGGMVHSYGLAASQLQRLRENNIPLTVCVDKVAASGGYLMACVADKILAAPFAIIGSIGVIGQVPNFHRLLKKNNIDFEQITAGEFKRTLTLFGENTNKARDKFKEDLEAIHLQFKQFITENRPKVVIDQVATGEHWLAAKAQKLNLVDGLMTSDDYLLYASKKSDIYQVNFMARKSLLERLTQQVQSRIEKAMASNGLY